MLSPDKLELKDIPKAVRGYSIPETDNLLKYLYDCYVSLYAEYNALEKKYESAMERVRDSEKDEESIRSALINAQKASSKITREANEKADLIVRSTKVACDKIMDDFRRAVAKEKLKLAAVVEAVQGFKEQLLELHREQMAQIEGLTEDDSYKELLDDDDKYADLVINGIKETLSTELGTEEESEGSDDEGGYDGPEPLDLDKAYERRNTEIEDDELEKPDQDIFEEAKHDSELENNPTMTKQFKTVKRKPKK
ncbi:MAG: DivIVA domain-containing protein [Clostridia bacterium]|nr:DivIVA domain-containing protein [Clostridia bacterium]